MLFILTGDIQIGKTRWLTDLVERMLGDGVPVAGVVAPGVWREPGADGSVREKIGIDNVLLPSGERIPFATRRDLLDARCGRPSTAQSDAAQLGWAISDEALTCVDRHFSRLEKGAYDDDAPGLLVVDELGRLELMRGEGLVSAMVLLDAGPTRRWPHAIVVVRDWLCPAAVERFAAAWGEPALIGPDDDGVRLVVRTVRS